MEDVERYFEENVKEVEAYFAFLRQVLNNGAQIHLPNKKSWKFRPIESQTQKTLKATALLILYNLVEASLMRSIPKIYEAIESDNLKFEQLAEELKKLWLKNRARNLTTGPVSTEKVREVLGTVVTDILNDACAVIDPRSLRIAGNLDVRKIQKIAMEHGFSDKVKAVNNQGSSLLMVKEKRNALAHGVITFETCGRDFTITDLERLKTDVVRYMRKVVRSTRRHIDDRKYAASTSS